MSGTATTVRRRAGAKRSARLAVAGGAVAALVIAMALDTRVVRIGSPADVEAGVFSPSSYGRKEFPRVQAAIEAKATDAATLAAAIAKDQDAATKRYAVASASGPEFPVRFTGKVSRDADGDTVVAVPGMPAGTTITLQTGPAIIGTDLRDAAGFIGFGQFHNQIEYQNAGAALNDRMKRDVLSGIDPAHLSGRTISVVGAFQLSDPDSWQVTPVQLVVGK